MLRRRMGAILRFVLLLGASQPAIGANAGVVPPSLPERIVAPTDRAKFGRVVLDNGLRVLLVSDPNFNKSSASLVVGVGQLEDPEDTTGLAHLTEHMLFLGTEKYPQEGEYDDFVRSNGGYANAYTAFDHTNFQFEIRHEAFDDALDRFAQFFIAPLFTPTFTIREIIAVDNEVMRFGQDDDRRTFNVVRELFTAGSPESRFTAGNKETLAHADSAKVRAFFESHYSAQRMALCLTGNASLGELEKMARGHFSAIPNRHLPALKRSARYFPPQEALRLAQVEPIGETRQLQIYFPVDGTRADFAAKNTVLISLLLSHSSPGGLEYKLKDAGLALSASGGIGERCAEYGTLFVEISLTPEGAKRLSDVFDIVMGYLDFLRHIPFPSGLWHENARQAALVETYNDRGEGASLATRLANAALFYPLEIGERADIVWAAPNPDGFHRILSQIRPDNMLAVFTAKGVRTDRTEHFYGASYSYSADTGSAYRRIRDAHDPADGSFALPRPNPYVVENPKLLVERPVKLVDEPELTLFYAEDMEFRRPRSALMMRFVPVRGRTDARSAALLALYSQCLNDGLTAISDEAARTNASFTAGIHVYGFSLSASGYGETPVLLAREAVGQLRNLAPAAERFAVLKEGLIRSLRSFPRTEALRLTAVRRDAWTTEFDYLPDELLSYVIDATWPDVKAAAEALLAKGKLEILVQGHLSPEAAVASAREITAGIGFTSAPADRLLVRRELTQEAGEVIIDAGSILGANSVYAARYLLPDDSPRHRAIAAMLGNFISQPFFVEMRTRQQLGYVANAGTAETRRTQSLGFLIQSSGYSPDQLRARAERFLVSLPDSLAALPAIGFENLRAGVRAQLEQKPKNIAEKARQFFERAYDYHEEWDRNDKTLAALNQLTQKEAVAILRATLTGPGVRQRLLLLNGEYHAPSDAETSFSDRTAWKKTRTFH